MKTEKCWRPHTMLCSNQLSFACKCVGLRLALAAFDISVWVLCSIAQISAHYLDSMTILEQDSQYRRMIPIFDVAHFSSMIFMIGILAYIEFNLAYESPVRVQASAAVVQYTPRDGARDISLHGAGGGSIGSLNVGGGGNADANDALGSPSPSYYYVYL